MASKINIKKNINTSFDKLSYEKKLAKCNDFNYNKTSKIK